MRNQELVHPNKKIAGLNLGLNTSEDDDIVFANREELLDEIGVEVHEIAYAIQVHGTSIKVVDQGGTFPNTDGFVCNTPGLALTIQVADCAAVLLGDDKNEVIGAAHAGWRGAAGDIVPKTIQEMKQLGADPKAIKAFISPCISLKNFEVGEEVAVEFPDAFVDRTNYAKPHVDLKAFLKHQLIETGVPELQISIDEHCTIANEDFYSYRRQKGESGRMMGIIKLNKQ
ncbi:peptidoglycan editing factor PgeF [Gracilimonas mengyeensis]|uniref:peptidoglycan editing factor PgeF n=1 Tax=Gracilimonas mengyeensis TaxID=1302730 RepID=UPI00163D6151|nr:peptidoglycan editing factor PgeF [Gracilimonas mengyeensis]